MPTWDCGNEQSRELHTTQSMSDDALRNSMCALGIKRDAAGSDCAYGRAVSIGNQQPSMQGKSEARRQQYHAACGRVPKERVDTMTRHTWTMKDMKKAAAMWAEGAAASHIADVLGVTKQVVCGMAFRNRDLFPKRTEGRNFGRKKKRLGPDVATVQKTTYSGTITLPRLKCLEDNTV